MPGIEQEKTEHYLKCLPKSFRKMCQPYSQTANKFLEQANRNQSFSEALQAYLKQTFSLNVEFSQYSKIFETTYYQMNFFIIKESKVIDSGRDLAKLQDLQKSSLQTETVNIICEFETGKTIKQGQFGTLPNQCQILINQQKSIAYPYLKIQSNNGNNNSARAKRK